VTPIWFVILGVAWVIMRKRPSHLARYAEFQKDLAGEKVVAEEKAEAKALADAKTAAGVAAGKADQER
jgi:D-serine/D-alanine/glycine transporter